MLFLFLLFSSLAQAYDFPYQDPYYATVTAALLKADDRAPVAYKNIFLKPLPARDQTPYYGANRNKIQVKFWPANKTAPLVIILAGLGGNSGTTSLNFLADQFHKNGFQVLTMPSPFNWNFALSASGSGYPGITSDDARDTYKLMQLALTEIFGSNKPAQINLLGISIGALEAGFIDVYDRQENKISFRRTLLINPPVDVPYSISKLDELFAEGKNLTDEQKKNLHRKAAAVVANALTTKDIKSPDYFLGLEKALPVTEAERKFLIGTSLRDFLSALVFTTQQIKDRGVLKGSDADAQLNESVSWSFQDYIDKLLLPTFSEQLGHAVTADELQKNVSFQGIEKDLNHPRISLMHNQDDFIVSGSQINYLQHLFGSRAKFYPRGGHVGNLWYPENLADIMNTFKN